MRLVDLTQTISEDMPVYPGTEKPKLPIVNTLEEHGFIETLLTMYSHTGTHMDTPGHLLAGKMMLDDMPITHFAGKGLVINATDRKAGEKITIDYINKVKDKADKADFLLFRTDWDKYWENEEKYFGDYPVIDDDIIKYIIDTKKKGVGFDYIGIDPMWDEALTLHKKLFNVMDIVIIENLTNLGQCGDDIFLFCALPLKYKNSDGAPVRSIGILDVL